VSTGAKEDESSTERDWAAGFSPGGRFETDEPFISLIFQFFQVAANRSC
jgi:hypothetical protein